MSGLIVLKKLFRKILFTALIYTGLFIMISGVFVFIYQIFNYLYVGEWIPLPMIIIVPSLIANWLIDPHQWIGLSNVLSSLFDTIPLSVFLLIMGILIMIVSGDKYENGEEK